MHDHNLKQVKRISAILKLRNYPDGRLVDDLLSLVSDDKEDVEVRCNTANVLGWFEAWYAKASIVNKLRTLKVDEPALKDEICCALCRLTRQYSGNIITRRYLFLFCMKISNDRLGLYY